MDQILLNSNNSLKHKIRNTHEQSILNNKNSRDVCSVYCCSFLSSKMVITLKRKVKSQNSDKTGSANQLFALVHCASFENWFIQ